MAEVEMRNRGRRRDARLLTADMRQVIAEQMLGHVASVNPDGTPNLSPKGTLSVWDDGTLVFADLRSPRTIRNLRSNPAVEVNVIDPLRRSGYRFKGAAEVVDSGPEYERALSFFDTTVTRARERIRCVVFIHVTSASALTSPAYDLGRTETEVTEQWARHYASLLRLQGNQLTEIDAPAGDG